MTTSRVFPVTTSSGVGCAKPIVAVEAGLAAAGLGRGTPVGPKIMRGMTAALIASTTPTAIRA